MHQSLYARTKLHKSAKRRDACDLALDIVAFLKGFNLLQPWIFTHLLKAQ